MSSKGSSNEGSNIPYLDFSSLSLEANSKPVALMEKGRFHEAVNECLSILENGPQDEDTKMVLSTVYMIFGEIKKTQVLLTSIDAQDPGSLPILLTKRLHVVSQHMKKAESVAFNEKKWDMVRTHTEAAKDEGADMCIKLYLHRAEASLQLELVKEAISEVLSAMVSLHKKNGEET